MICTECEKERLLRAVKCEQYGMVFLYESVPGGYTDRCPECGYSKKQEQRKKAAAQQAR